MKFDLSKFKKTAQDKHSTTLMSPEGHSITIVHASLSPLNREQLKRLKMAKGGGVANYDEGSDPAPVSQDDVTPDQSADQGGATTIVNVGQGSAPAQASVPAQPSVPAQYAAQPVVTQAPAVPQNTPPNTAPNGTMNPGAVAQNTQAGAGLQRDVDIAKGQAMANVQKGYTDAAAANAQRDQDNFKKFIVQPTQDFKSFVDANPINPNHWAESQGTAQKVGTALGLLLGGFATNGGTGTNPVYDWMNKQIDRDISAQQARVNNQKTVLGAYQQLYGDSNVANNLAKASLRDIYDSKAKQIAFQLNTPQAWANYQQFAADQAIKKSKDLQDAAVNLKSLPGYSRIGATPAAPAPNPVNPAPAAPQPRGTSGASASWGEPNAEAAQATPDQPSKILVPGAQGILNSLRYMPKARDEINQIKEQYTQAQQAEKALAAIDEKFPQLRGEATYSGNAAGHINPNSVAAIGAGLGAMVGGAGGTILSAPVGGAGGIPGAAAGGAEGALLFKGAAEAGRGALNVLGGQKQVQYEADKSAVTKVIAAALRGTNVSSEQIQDVVDSNTPSVWDSASTYRKKINNIKEFIRNNTATSLLEDWGLARPSMP